MKKNETEQKIIDIINHLRPFLVNDGGNIEFVKYEDNIVYIKMMGACANCQMLDLTLKDGIEAAIKEEIDEVLGVVNLSESSQDYNDIF
ncbi:MAG TPA: NifU family protein [Bacilli bacterium]|nr:NifU family protein [Bacilli bacterium]